MNAGYEKLLLPPNAFNEAEYLSFLSRRVPRDLAEQLTRDAHPELLLDEYVGVADLMRPLLSHVFLEDCDYRSTRFFRLATILEYTLSGYALDIEHERSRAEPYKQIYIASFYLYCCLHGAYRSREYLPTLLVLVNAVKQVDLDGQLQVIRFLGSMTPLVPGASVADPAPLSCMFIASSLILANTLTEISLLAEHAMGEEGFLEAWRKEENEYLRAMHIVARLTREFFGESGKVEGIARCFRGVATLGSTPQER